MTALALTIRARCLRVEDMRILLGESEDGAGSIRNEFAHIRARRTCIDVERLQVFCETLDVDAMEVIAGSWQPPVWIRSS